MQISTVNILQMVKDMAYITIGINFEDACGLLISIFTFDLGPF